MSRAVPNVNVTLKLSYKYLHGFVTDFFTTAIVTWTLWFTTWRDVSGAKIYGAFVEQSNRAL